MPLARPFTLAALLIAAALTTVRGDDGFSVPPTPADKALATFEVHRDMQLELVAAEPLVMDPVAIDWGPDGKLWVVEMADYPLGIDGKGKPGGRLRYLEDKDGNGTYESSTLFLDGLNFPTGVMAYRRGVLVTAAPEIFYAEDRDGDGRADHREALYVGFGEGNQQHRVNGLRWGLDNWIHCANGDSNGVIESKLTGQKVDISGRDFRIRPWTGEIETQTGRSQFGRDTDDWGNWFGTSNSRPLTHFVIPDEYLRRNPQAAVTLTTHEVPEIPGPAPIFPISKTLERFNDYDRANRFTSACGSCFYRDDRLDDPTNGQPSAEHSSFRGNAFICEPVHNLVHREVITPSGATFVGRRAPEEQQREFLASRDPWFRPVMARTGPDGALYIVDMYRLVIEHPQWIPEHWQKRLDLRAGHDRGRIYRVYRRGVKPRTVPRVNKLATAELVAILASSNGTLRDMAQKQLVTNRDLMAVKGIRKLLEDNLIDGSALTASACLATLDGLGAIDSDLIAKALKAKHAGILRLVIRLSEPFYDRSPRIVQQLSELQPKDTQVALQQTLSLGSVANSDQITKGRIAPLAVQYADDPLIASAVACAIHGQNATAILAAITEDVILDSKKSAPPEITYRLGLAIGKSDNREDIFNAAKYATYNIVPPGEPVTKWPKFWRVSLLRGLLDGIDARGRDWEKFFGDTHSFEYRLFDGGIKAFLANEIRKLVQNDGADVSLRAEAIQLLGRRPDDLATARIILLELLGSRQPAAIQQAAARSLARQSDEKLAEEFLNRLSSLSPSVRGTIIDSLLNRTIWTQRLLDRIEAGTLPPTEIDAARRQRLLKSKDDGIRSRAEKLLAPDSNRQQVVDSFADVATLPGDKARGLEAFRRRCSTCHKWGDVGVQVGPDLLGMRDRSRQSLLIAILDPNRAVETKYIGYTAITTAGVAHVGIVENETASSIVLLGPEGKRVDLLRADLDEFQSTSKSMMPEGLEKDLGKQDLADLLMLLSTEPLAVAAPAKAPTPTPLPTDAGATDEDANEEDDEEPEYRAGLSARYRDSAGTEVRRVDADVQFNWSGATPDERLKVGPFDATWEGRLFCLPGRYQLRVFAAGRVTVTLQGKELLAAESAEPAWLDAQPVDIPYGFHPLKVTYRAAGKNHAQVGLFWSGPQFQLEPITDRYFFHDPKQSPDVSFEQGRQLVRALRCDACHSAANDPAPLSAPSLTHVRGNLDADWLQRWLTAAPEPANAGDKGAPTATGDVATVAGVPRRMPHLNLSADDASAIAAVLYDASAESAAPAKYVPAVPDKKVKKKPRTKPDPKEGMRLFNTVGCLACHRVGERGVLSLMGGGDLSSVARKRPADFFARWLREPGQVNPAHRMPVFALSDLEREDLRLYLELLLGEKPAKAERAKEPNDRTAQLARGKELIASNRCASCHELPKALAAAAPARIPLTTQSRWSEGCSAAAKLQLAQPRYALNPKQAALVKSYLSAPRPADESPHKLTGATVLAERNCLACHARGNAPGIAAHFEALTRDDPELATLLPTFQPPALSGVGDKLHDTALADAILLRRPPLRPWLAIRMPKFPINDAELAALAEHLIAHDRIPQLAVKPDKPLEPADVLAARRLVTADGFGCTSCHKIGNAEPQNVALNAHGTDLTMLGGRIREAWYDRWVRNPARIVPRMEMPAIQKPVHGLLGDNVDAQLAAVWNTLNTPGFNPPPPGPVRVVRSRNVPGADAQPSVITDVFETPGRTYFKPVVIGLANRHNVLFDCESGSLADWWLGDTAFQRTRGKSWFWEPGGESLLSKWRGEEPLLPEIELELPDGKRVGPIARGQWQATLDEYRIEDNGFVMKYRLYFPEQNGKMPSLVVEQGFQPIGHPPGGRGFNRAIQVQFEGWKGRVWFHPLGNISVQYADNTRDILEPFPANVTQQADTKSSRMRIEAKGLRQWLKRVDRGGGRLTMAAELSPFATLHLAYHVALVADAFPNEPPQAPPRPTVKLKVTPGFDAVQLPLPMEYMPTGFAWRGDRSLLFTSLKGQVCQANDSDDDGLEDQVTVLTDGLAAPYGLALHESLRAGPALDIITKLGLVRFDLIGGKRLGETCKVVADGWGHTDDYHDWAVGLPSDNQGNYLVALPCQQDDRSEAAAKWRGQLLRLKPRNPWKNNPRLFDVEPVCGGLRFPMGLAVNQAGDVFASDNQGNYNPFNEVNHLRPGMRYGFINELEKRAGFTAPEEMAAVALPHPWTRSVNGLCFLDTPPAAREKLGGDAFGPFEGHLIGTEFTTLRLIRMTLDRVGDTYQGAAYPFSVVPPQNEPTFEGPIVAAVSPAGDLYVGNLRDSGWGGGQNTGSIVRLRPQLDKIPLGIRHARAVADGFELEFTGEIDAARAGRREVYAVSSYRRVSTPAYGGENIDERTERVSAVKVSDDRRRVHLRVDHLRAGHVYELRVGAVGATDEPLFPAEAIYTLRVIPGGK
ncbi:MAG: hypothetical protein JSS27_16095 [Planctomycetes bacterium]|nr:hypothetical protein [Planctomycetota bacterium]